MAEYADSNGWGDLLTSYDGETITYDTIGNPLTYRDGMTMTWVNGRELSSLSKDGKTYNFTYDPSGLRTKKSITTSSGSTTNVEYIYEGSRLMQMTYGNYVLDFSYDANGTPVAFHVDNGGTVDKYYYYGVNSRGDVEALYNADGTLHARYEYDAYGKILSVKASDGTNITATYAIAVLNPLRYRSYVYDNETGFYYLQSRYYDPTTCRFINVDNQLTVADPNNMNLFAYCSNNPVNRIDPTGEAWWHWAIGAAIVVACAAATVVTCGGFAAAAGAVAAVASGVAAASTASTIAAGAFIGSAVALGTAVVAASSNSSSIQEFNEQGNWGTVARVAGGGLFGGASSYMLTPTQKTSDYPPNNGFNAEPRNSVLAPGSKLQRVGGTSGTFVAPIGTPHSSISLPPDKCGAQTMNLEVLKPISVQAGTAMPWYGQSGGGTQFVLPNSIGNLIADGSLKILP